MPCGVDEAVRGLIYQLRQTFREWTTDEIGAAVSTFATDLRRSEAEWSAEFAPYAALVLALAELDTYTIVKVLRHGQELMP